MEVEETQSQQQPPKKLSRVGDNVGVDNNGVQTIKKQSNDDDHLRGWHHSSRIIRVSRASGGKDRHSKVWTSKGLRDRRVRLSVTTAIQFYDLQDRLGFDQPSKAVEWLIKAAADSIAELPSLNDHFLSVDQKLPEEGDDQCQNSTSDTSKGSGLSISRWDARVKARERARERTAKDKEKEKEKEKEDEPTYLHHHHDSTFTGLLTAGYSGQLDGGASSEGNLFHKVRQSWSLTPMDYIGGNIGQFQFAKPEIPQHASVVPQSAAQFSGAGEANGHHHQQMEHFPFASEHLILPVPATSDYNLNFTISPSPAGFSRGTLQSNSTYPHQQSLRAHLQRLTTTVTGNNSSFPPSQIDASANYLPFFLGSAAMENHHQQFPPSGLHLLYGEGSRHEHKGKGKN